VLTLGTWAQIMIVGWAVLCPLGIWRSLGNAEFVSSLSPRLQKAYGVQIFTGMNGKTIAEPPPPLKRLKVSLLLGLLTAAIFSSVLAFVVHLFQ
jgi:hypothetical protein